MTIKERPLINAVSRLGPLPAFIFENPIFAGFFAMIMCAVFGAFFAFFVAAVFGLSTAYELFDFVRWGAIIVVAFASFIFAGIAISAYSHTDEKQHRLRFFYGGVFGVVFLVIVDLLTRDALIAWLTPIGRVV